VIIYTSKPTFFERKITIVNKANEIIKEGCIKLATNEPKIAFSDADMVLITMPSFCAENVFSAMNSFIARGVYVGFIPGTGGMECVFKDLIAKDCILFGLQRVPSVARLVEYGKTVCADGYREKLYLSAIPKKYSIECCSLMSQIFDIPCDPLPNFLNLTLTPSNPILHTTRLYTLFRDYNFEKVYSKNPLFYEDWDNETSSLLFKCDDEVQLLCKNLKDFDLSYIKSLKVHYESYTPEQLTCKIKSISGFKGLMTPMIDGGVGFIPDFNSRYFIADFGYGLSIVNQIADMVGLELPHITTLMNWFCSLPIQSSIFNFRKYGIDSYRSFKEFYST
ncbi:MAG: NAD/NADP octopine/nopaline dehydrogenase family protein, partial [Bacilli bacterium]|nr:NAD/NADP octopine/nopaline dehydrogenase family protein [Bacilli bacterium]